MFLLALNTIEGGPRIKVNAGDVFEADKDEADYLIDAGAAVPASVEETPDLENENDDPRYDKPFKKGKKMNKGPGGDGFPNPNAK